MFIFDFQKYSLEPDPSYVMESGWVYSTLLVTEKTRLAFLLSVSGYNSGTLHTELFGVSDSTRIVLSIFVSFFLFFVLFFFFRARVRAGRGRGRRTENLKQAPRLVQSPTQGSISQPRDHDLSRNQESDAQLTEPPRCPSPILLI